MFGGQKQNRMQTIPGRSIVQALEVIFFQEKEKLGFHRINETTHTLNKRKRSGIIELKRLF